jgi:preprotein translocase subunit SecG
MSILIGILTVIEVIVCLFLILIILMQRPRQEGLGAAFGGGVTDQMFGAQTTNVLQKFTGYLAAALFILTLVLAVLTTKVQRAKMADGKKLFEAPPPAVAPATPAATTPAPGAPATGVTAPAAVPAADGKTISVTKQPGATVVVKQPDGKPAAPAEKPDAKPADAAPQTKPAAPATTPAPAAATPPAPKPATPAAAATPPATPPAPPAPAKP